MEQNPAQQALQQSQQPQPAQDDLSATLLNKRKQLLAQYENAAPSPAAISQALAQMKPDSKSAAVQVGKALNPSSEWANLCEAFAEKQIYGRTGMFPTAYDAYQAHAQQGNIKTDFKKGDQLFFDRDSSNGMNGHTAVAINDKEFVAPLSDGSIKTFNLAEWTKYSGQAYLGSASAPKSK